MDQYQNFTSLPDAQEKQFVVYEQRSVETGKAAWMYGMIIGGIVFVASLGIYFGFSHKEKGHQLADTELGRHAGKKASAADTPDKPKPPATKAADSPESDTAKPASDKSDDTP